MNSDPPSDMLRVAPADVRSWNKKRPTSWTDASPATNASLADLLGLPGGGR